MHYVCLDNLLANSVIMEGNYLKNLYFSLLYFRDNELTVHKKSFFPLTYKVCAKLSHTDTCYYYNF